MAILRRPVFLLSDWGLRDQYVGQVKAVIASIAPESALHDLTHEVAPFAVDEGAWLLGTSLEVLPEDAVVMAVVDPGVGTKRRPLVAQVGRRTFVGPDNGVLSRAVPLVPGGQPGREPVRTAVSGIGHVDVRELCEPSLMRPRVSNTFHGRDMFAPAAAHIAAGADYRRAGPPRNEMYLFPAFCARPGEMGVLEGEVVHVDRFGNLVTTVRASQLFPSFTLELNGHVVDTQVRTFAEVAPGRPFCHVDSTGYLAVAMNRGNAAETLGVKRGAAVRVRAR